MAQLLALNKRLKASKDEHVEFVAIEAVGEDDSRGTEMPVYALAVYEVHGPGNKEFPEKRQYALAILKGQAQRQTIRMVGRRRQVSLHTEKLMCRPPRALPTTVTATHTDDHETTDHLAAARASANTCMRAAASLALFASFASRPRLKDSRNNVAKQCSVSQSNTSTTGRPACLACS